MLSFFTVDKEKKSAKENYDDSHTFGGFSSRWNYEDCRRRLSGVHPAAIVLISMVCVFTGLSGVLGGILLFDFLKANPGLYFPEGTVFSASEPTELHAPVAPDDNGDSDELYTGMSLDTGTPDLASRFMIPVGVMVRSADPTRNAALRDLIAGDIIVTINDNEIRDIESLREVYDPIPDGDDVHIRVFRRNKYTDVYIVKGVH